MLAGAGKPGAAGSPPICTGKISMPLLAAHTGGAAICTIGSRASADTTAPSGDQPFLLRGTPPPATFKRSDNLDPESLPCDYSEE
jgi:hypothetical protein